MTLKISLVLLLVAATHLLTTVAEEAIGAPISPNLLTRVANLNTREGLRPRPPRFSTSSTAVLVPIATVCPYGGGPGISRGPFAPISLPTVMPSSVTDTIVSATAVMPDGSSTTFASRVKKDNDVSELASETTTLPDGLDAMPMVGRAADIGQLVIGSNRCQTLYMPTRTAICSTVITPAALPPVTITDCNQYITFSSETLFACNPTPAVTPHVPGIDSNDGILSSIAASIGTLSTSLSASSQASQHHGFNVRDIVSVSAMPGMPMSLPRHMQERFDLPSKRQILISKGKPITTDLATIAFDMLGKRQNLISGVTPVVTNPTKAVVATSVPMATSIRSFNSTHPNSTILDAGIGRFTPIRLAGAQQEADAANLSPPAPTKYYAAPWYEIVRGGVPTHVQGITCYGGLEPLGDCLAPDMPGDGDLEKCECSTVDESWTITTQTLTRVGYTVASFNGPVLVTAGTLTTTTRISFTTTVQTTRTFTQASVKKITLSTPSVEPTITATLTKTPSATVSLVSLPQITGIATPNVRPAMAESPQEAPSSITSDDVPTTVFETSIVATETVTLPQTDTFVVNSNSQDTGLENDITALTAQATAAPVKRNNWLANIWAAHMPEIGA